MTRLPRATVALSLALGLATILAGAGLLYTSGLLISRAALHPPTLLSLMTLITGVRFFGLARAGARYAERLVSHDVVLRNLSHMRNRLFAALARLTPYDLLTERGGDLLARLHGDIDLLQGVYVRLIAPFTVAALTTLCTVLLLCGLEPLLAGVTAALLLTSIVLAPWLAYRISRSEAATLASVRGAWSARVLEGLRGSGDLLTLGVYLNRDTNTLALQLERADARRGRLLALFGTLRDLLSGLALWCALVIVGAGVGRGQLEGALLVGAALFVLGAFEAAQNLAGSALEAGELQGAAARVRSLSGAVTESQDLAPVEASFSDAMTLRFEGVSLRQGTRTLLKGIDLELPAGARVALVGPNGVGKSTVAALALGFLEPTSGRVTLGGVSRGSAGRKDTPLSTEAWQRPFSWAGQDAHLFATSLRANLLLGHAGATDDDIKALLGELGLGHLLRAPGGLDLPLGEHGTRLSGGERARVALARALLKPSRILILDEPTAHHDPDTERLVMETLMRRLEGRSLLLITHRPAPLAYMDTALRLERGTLHPYPLSPKPLEVLA